MGWFLGCFKCRRKRPTGSTINFAARCKDGRRVFSPANSAQAKESIEVEKFLSGQGDETKKQSSACIKTERRSRSAKRPSSEKLLQAEKHEEEIDSLNRKVRHLRNCSALLDSPNAFRKALNALEQALEKGYVEESQPLLYLQSLLSKMESSEAAVNTSSGERDEERKANGFPECIDSSSSTTRIDQKSSEKALNTAIQAEPDRSQGNIFTSVAVSREPDQGQRLALGDEQSVCDARQQHFSNVMDQDANKTETISVVKRRSSKTLSFSGFLLVEGVTEARPVLDKSAAGEQFSSTEFSVTKIIEKTDSSGENLVEVSKSLFAFSTDNPQGHSTLTAEALFGNVSKEFSFSISDADADSWSSEMSDGNRSFSNLQHSSPSWLWSPQDCNPHDVGIACRSVSTEQCQIDAIETSHHGFSDAHALSLSSTFCSSSMDHASFVSVDSEEVDSRHGTKAGQMQEDNVSVQGKANPRVAIQAIGMSQPGGIGDAMAGSCRNVRSTEVQAGSVTSSKDISGDEASVELSSPCIWSPDTQTSPYDAQTLPYAVHTPSPSSPVGGIKGGPSDFFSETPSTPVSVNSHESRLQLAKTDASMLEFTPLRTPSTSLTQGAETPSTSRSQGSPSSVGEDRPILGTVAAHWNPSLTSPAQKWWDGKGIPNSTNKYKEDQKVRWHATPFEVRLERALAKHGRVFQKNLFPGAMATETEVSM